MRAAFASPVADKVEPLFVKSLTETLGLLHARGHEADWRFVSSSVLHESRNTLARDQLRSGADILVQADADQTFDAECLVNAIECVAAGHADVLGFPITVRRPGAKEKFASPALIDEADPGYVGRPRLPFRAFRYEGVRYVEVAHVSGIVVFSRRCVEQLSADAERAEDGSPILWDFGGRNAQGARVGEDMYFSQRWRAAGGRIFCNFAAKVGHVGKFSFGSDYAGWLTPRLEAIGLRFDVRDDPPHADAAE